MRNWGYQVPIIIVLLIICVSVAYAGSSIGITPVKKSYFMKPGDTIRDSTTIIYAEPYASVAKIAAYGDFAEWVEFEQDSVKLPAGGPGTTIRYTIKVPEEFGSKTSMNGDIRIELLPPAEEFKAKGTTGAYAAIGMIVNLKLPRPGKYLEAAFRPIENVNAGEIVYFVLDAKNYGTDYLKDISGKIKILDASGNLVLTVSTGVTSLASGGEGQLYGYWETENALPSFYTAVAEIEYGGDNPATSKGMFLVGDLIIKINDVLVNTSHRDVVMFDIALQSLWNAEISNVFAQIDFSNSTGFNVGQSKSTSENIGPRGKATLKAYLDSGYLTAGEYTAHIVVHYASKTVEKIVKFTLDGEKVSDGPRLNTLVYGLFTGTNLLLLIMIVLLVNLFIFLLMSRKRDDDLKRSTYEKPTMQSNIYPLDQPIQQTQPIQQIQQTQQIQQVSQINATQQIQPAQQTQHIQQTQPNTVVSSDVEGSLDRLEELMKK